MPSITPANALKLSAWLAHEHPPIFRALLKQVNTQQKLASKGLGFLGDDLETVDVGGGSVDYAPSLTDVGISSDPTLSDISSVDSSLGSVDLGSILSSGSDTASSGGFWSTLGSDLSGAGSSLVSGVASVAGALISPTSIAAVGNAASAYFKSQTPTATTAAQQAVLNAQLARTVNGAGAAPISYTTNAAGQLVPVYYGQTGATPVTSQLLSSLTSGGSMLPILLIGGAALVGVLLMSRSTSRK